MTTTTAPRTALAIREAVEAELGWTPQVDAPSIGVAVEHGVVTLSGEVTSITERGAAKNAALRVRGVTTVADEIVVRYPGSPRTDTDIAEAVKNAFAWSSIVPADKVKAEVHNHVVTLTGSVDWDYQRRAARRTVEHLAGVRMVQNNIQLTARPSATDAEHRIKAALVRNASLDANTIDVVVNGNTVTLTGTVSSWAEKKQAGRAAWSSPHVDTVLNHISVSAA